MRVGDTLRVRRFSPSGVPIRSVMCRLVGPAHWKAFESGVSSSPYDLKPGDELRVVSIDRDVKYFKHIEHDGREVELFIPHENQNWYNFYFEIAGPAVSGHRSMPASGTAGPWGF